MMEARTLRSAQLDFHWQIICGGRESDEGHHFCTCEVKRQSNLEITSDGAFQRFTCKWGHVSYYPQEVPDAFGFALPLRMRLRPQFLVLPPSSRDLERIREFERKASAANRIVNKFHAAYPDGFKP